MTPVQYKEYNRTFNARGLLKEKKQKLLAQDMDSYNIDVCYLQET